MPLDPARVLGLMKSGMSMVCATCIRLQEAYDRDRAQSCGQVDCGGPIAGKDFPKYKGQLPDLQRWCFVCGADSNFSISVPDGVRPVGVCKQHVKLLHDLVPEKTVEGKLIFQIGGKYLSLEEICEAPKPSLMQQIIMDEIEDSKKPC